MALPEDILSALVGAGAALVTSAIAIIGLWWRTSKTLTVTARSHEEERLHQAVLTALSYLQGGTQERNVGISQIATLSKRPDADRYREVFLQALHGQVVYVLSEGGNRFKMHELLNAERMMEVLLSENFFTDSGRARDTLDATKQFLIDCDIEHTGKLAHGPRGEFIARFANEKVPAWRDRIKKQAELRVDDK